MDPIEIPVSKTKMLLGIMGSVLFVILGFYLFTPIADRQDRFDPTFVKCAGIAGIAFFGTAGLYGIKKLLTEKTGLIINEQGILNHSNASGIGLIRWEDITEIRTTKVSSTKFLLVYVANPDAYLNRVKGIKRKLMEGNMNMYGTPLSITSSTLKYSFSDLEKLLQQKLFEARTKHAFNKL